MSTPGAPGQPDGHDEADLARAVEILRAAGATDDDFVRLDLHQLAGELSVRPQGRRISWEELVARSGTEEAMARELVEACGLPVGPEHAWYESDVEILEAMAVAAPALGWTAVLGLMRRTGTAVSLLAAASSGAFRVSSAAGPLSGAVPETGPLAGAVERILAPQRLVAVYLRALEQVLRHHYLMGFRPDVRPAGEYGELRSTAIGFVDLTASTALGARSTADELAAAMTAFETACNRAAVRHGVRVVKTIGDEVMLASPEPGAVCAAAVALVADLVGHEVFENARGGVAFGNVLEQDGDYFGPVVNTAARLVEAAPDGAVMATAEVGDLLVEPLRGEEREARIHRGLGVLRWGEVVSSPGRSSVR
jgi:adenylate cyclase